MKLLRLTTEALEAIKNAFLAKFDKEITDYQQKGPNGGKFEVKFNFEPSKKAEGEERVTILFEPTAYLKMEKLVDYFKSEVGWYGLVTRRDDHTFYVYDVRICKQVVSGTKVDTEPEDELEFRDQLSDDELNHMHFQAHSHVDLKTDPSGCDDANQIEYVNNLNGKGFFIFQIWNKKGDINTFVYDLDNNKFYDRNDVDIRIEIPEGTIDNFIAAADKLVSNKSTVSTSYNGYSAGYTYTGYVAKGATDDKETSFGQYYKGSGSQLQKKADEKNESAKTPAFTQVETGNAWNGDSHLLS